MVNNLQLIDASRQRETMTIQQTRVSVATLRGSSKARIKPWARVPHVAPPLDRERPPVLRGETAEATTMASSIPAQQPTPAFRKGYCAVWHCTVRALAGVGELRSESTGRSVCCQLGITCYGRGQSCHPRRSRSPRKDREGAKRRPFYRQVVAGPRTNSSRLQRKELSIAY